jgi:hypothetical protein
MKNILLITLCSLLYCNIIVGQCPPLEVSTDPQNPFNEEVGNVQSSLYFNNFNWQIPNYNPSNYVLSTVQSPFESTTGLSQETPQIMVVQSFMVTMKAIYFLSLVELQRVVIR